MKGILIAGYNFYDLYSVSGNSPWRKISAFCKKSAGASILTHSPSNRSFFSSVTCRRLFVATWRMEARSLVCRRLRLCSRRCASSCSRVVHAGHDTATYRVPTHPASKVSALAITLMGSIPLGLLLKGAMANFIFFRSYLLINKIQPGRVRFRC